MIEGNFAKCVLIYFAVRVVRQKNRLPRGGVDASSPEVLKALCSLINWEVSLRGSELDDLYGLSSPNHSIITLSTQNKYVKHIKLRCSDE